LRYAVPIDCRLIAQKAVTQDNRETQDYRCAKSSLAVLQTEGIEPTSRLLHPNPLASKIRIQAILPYHQALHDQ
jgi:hypothetical protein